MKKIDLDKKSNQKKQKKIKKTAHYGFLQAMFMSFFSRQIYIDVVRRWRGFGLLYLFVMLSVLILPYAVQMMMVYQESVDQKLILPLKKLPPISVREGSVYFHSPMPYLIKNEQDQVIAVIDTEGTVTKLPSYLYPDATVLVTKHALHLLEMNLPMANFLKPSHASHVKEMVSPFAINESFNFFGQDWLDSSYFEITTKLLAVFIYFALLMVLYSLCFTLLFSTTLLGQSVARFVFKVQLTFKETARLMVIAATPEVAVYFTLLTFNQVNFGGGMFYISFLAIFFSLGVLAYRQDNRAMILQ
jgi:hypothetical protein